MQRALVLARGCWPVAERSAQKFDAGARVAAARHPFRNEMEIPVGLVRDEHPARQHAEQQHRGDDQRFAPQRAHRGGPVAQKKAARSEEHTSELQSLMRISYAVFCLKKKKKQHTPNLYKKRTKHNSTQN